MLKKAFLTGWILAFLPIPAFAGEPAMMPLLNVLDAGVTQVVVVAAPEPEKSAATLTLYERRPGKLRWDLAMDPVEAVIGRNGLAAFGHKQEGDGKTPQGIFKLGPAFGYAPKIKTGLDYRQATDEDIWIDDSASEQYNTWVIGDTQAQSFEKLKRDDDLYKYAAVIQYNTDVPVAGAGSAIFLHVWRGPDKPTAGCVAVAEKSLVKLLERLDRKRQPAILISP